MPTIGVFLAVGPALLKILNLFAQHSIDAVGFKGPVQSEVLFQAGDERGGRTGLQDKK